VRSCSCVVVCSCSISQVLLKHVIIVCLLCVVQGVTYCGESKASNLTMENVPWHEEVVDFVQRLAGLLRPHYALASEHAHSNCVLLAHTKVVRLSLVIY